MGATPPKQAASAAPIQVLHWIPQAQEISREDDSEELGKYTWINYYLCSFPESAEKLLAPNVEDYNDSVAIYISEVIHENLLEINQKKGRFNSSISPYRKYTQLSNFPDLEIKPMEMTLFEESKSGGKQSLQVPKSDQMESFLLSDLINIANLSCSGRKAIVLFKQPMGLEVERQPSIASVNSMENPQDRSQSFKERISAKMRAQSILQPQNFEELSDICQLRSRRFEECTCRIQVSLKASNAKPVWQTVKALRACSRNEKEDEENSNLAFFIKTIDDTRPGYQKWMALIDQSPIFLRETSAVSEMLGIEQASRSELTSEVVKRKLKFDLGSEDIALSFYDLIVPHQDPFDSRILYDAERALENPLPLKTSYDNAKVDISQSSFEDWTKPTFSVKFIGQQNKDGKPFGFVRVKPIGDKEWHGLVFEHQIIFLTYEGCPPEDELKEFN